MRLERGEAVSLLAPIVYNTVADSLFALSVYSPYQFCVLKIENRRVSSSFPSIFSDFRRFLAVFLYFPEISSNFSTFFPAGRFKLAIIMVAAGDVLITDIPCLSLNQSIDFRSMCVSPRWTRNSSSPSSRVPPENNSLIR